MYIYTKKLVVLFHIHAQFNFLMAHAENKKKFPDRCVVSFQKAKIKSAEKEKNKSECR